MNTEQAPKRATWEPTRHNNGEGRRRPGSGEKGTGRSHRGSGDGTYESTLDATREVCRGAEKQRRTREDQLRPGHETLQAALQAKAKAAAGYRFYTLWDKVCREDVLAEAYRRCRDNGGAAGVDGQTFEAIESHGVKSWLAALRRKEYQPQPLLRVWIPKSSGGQRPLLIPTLRDCVVQMAALLVLGPIFEADLCDEQYGFRPGIGAKTAVRRAYFHAAERGLTEVVDADLSDYFSTIPHGALMRCLGRRIADGSVLSLVKRWLRAPVVERQKAAEVRTTAAADTNRGVPQGSPISPLLANLYFRRFVLAWKQFGHEQRLGARVVNYADDLVICCRPGSGAAALTAFRGLI